MPKSKSRLRSRHNGGPLRGLAKVITRTAGKLITTVTLAANAATRFVLNPGTAGFGTHLNTLATIFGKYRFTKMLFKIHPIVGAAGAAIAYLPDPVTNQPSSLIEMSQVLNCQIMSNSRVNPVTVRLGPQQLLSSGDFKWWQLQDAASDAELTGQGVIHILNLGSAEYTFPIELDYVCELCAPRGTAVYAPAPMSESTEWDEKAPLNPPTVSAALAPVRKKEPEEPDTLKTAAHLIGTKITECLREACAADRGK